MPLIVAGAGVAAARIGATSRRAPLLTIDVMPTVSRSRVAIPAQVEAAASTRCCAARRPTRRTTAAAQRPPRPARLVASRRFGVVDSVADPPARGGGVAAVPVRVDAAHAAHALRRARRSQARRDLRVGRPRSSRCSSNLGDWRQQSLVATSSTPDDLLSPRRAASARRARVRARGSSFRAGRRSVHAGLGSWYAAVRRLFVTMARGAAINPSRTRRALLEVLQIETPPSEAA